MYILTQTLSITHTIEKHASNVQSGIKSGVKSGNQSGIVNPSASAAAAAAASAPGTSGTRKKLNVKKQMSRLAQRVILYSLVPVISQSCNIVQQVYTSGTVFFVSYYISYFCTGIQGK